ncbi:hypothetical protein [Brachybacterium aquaticum]|uniref:Uncharacterized membrane protein YidH (DUF202 family) n=1 Tax=Brachybacterium aquaticum TaxID=1432564 RepID=A0A841AIB9_9MICO|nr:hypothetical protein [Brachybacterium aquaticum]MBB5832992.1 uncharacterized membrane protein YidH (DUF202 family) [Brachybacterium aquaticum]
MDDAPAARSGVSVLVLSDPGQCTARAEVVQERFEQELTRVFGAATVRVRPQFFGVSDTRTLDFAPIDTLRGGFDRVDAVLILTEMPRLSHGRPEIAKLFPEESAAALSYPALGVLAGERRLVGLFMSCVLRLVDGAPAEERERYALRWNRWTEPREGSPGYLHSHTITGMPRTVLGMVATNAPWRTAPQLSSALAAAAAVGAFGIFYTSIWQMSAALPTTRLLLIGLLAITLMVLWLLLSNGLWERAGRTAPGEVFVYYNLSTLLTLFLCVLALYLALFVVILGASLVVIDPDYMTDIMGTSVGLTNYVDLAWLSAAMGVVAGGLGTSFDESTDLRQLTHGRREMQRRPEEGGAEG